MGSPWAGAGHGAVKRLGTSNAFRLTALAEESEKQSLGSWGLVAAASP